ncbi:MAG: FMN-dependent NADH-azoreductase [Armatimonadota bacterium]
MATLLHILAHPTPQGSLTVRIADTFVESYRETHPDDAIITADLYRETVSPLTAAHITTMLQDGDVGKMTPEERAAWEELDIRLNQFCSADKFLVTAPMWNFGVPAVLKAYIDQVVQAGRTFRFTAPGSAVGLMHGKPMAIVSTRGGIFSQPPMQEYEMCVRYLELVFSFIGINIVHEIIAEGLAIFGPHEQDAIIRPALERAREAGKNF